MNIKNFTSFFHDGSIFDIRHKDCQIEILMESSEMDKKDAMGVVALSKGNRIRGILHLENVTAIIEDDVNNIINFKMKCESSEIFRFNIDGNTVLFDLIWASFSSKNSDEIFSTIKILSEKIWWENLPNMVVD